jgi:phage terminase large subunit-like protein
MAPSRSSKATSKKAKARSKPKPVHPVTKYAQDVVAGRIVTGRLVRLACERHLRDLKTGWRRGIRFDEAAADHALQFFDFLHHYKGDRWEGAVFKLEPWQVFIVGSVFGWMTAEGKRKYRKAYIQIARKNGKTILAAGIALYMLIADGEPGAEVYCLATKRDQARRLWEDAREFVLKSPELAEVVDIFRGTARLVYGNSYFCPLGSNANTLDSLNPHCAVVDEIHKLAKRRVWDVIETAQGARTQPLLLGITTSGFDQAGICYELRQYGLDILTAGDGGDNFFAYIAEMDEGDDWQDESCWIKGNPNLGVSIRIEELREEAEKAKRIPAAQATFRCDRLNQWVQQAEIWIPLSLWDANARDENGNPRAVNEESLRGRTCFGGLDLSQSQDLTFWTLVFPHEDDPETVDCLFRVWTIKARLYDPENRYADKYREWYDAGLLTAFDGPAIDYNAVKAQILADSQKFSLVDFNVDRAFQGMKVLLELQEEGFNAISMGMGHTSFTAPCVEFERRCLAKKINHGGHPIMRWMVNGLAVKRDEKATAVSMKPVKGNAYAKIDGPVTLIMALDRVMRHEGLSIYETRGVLSV